MKKTTKLFIILLLLLTLVGCKKKRKDDEVEIKDPSIEYKSTYDGSFGNAGPLNGNTIVISIFANDATTNWTNEKTDKKSVSTILDKLSSATSYLRESAAKYGRKATFVYNWETYPDLKYAAKFVENLATSSGTNYNIQKKWIETYINTKALKNKYQADNIIYLYFINTEFKNEVKPWTITHNNCNNCKLEYSNIYYRFNGIACPTATIAHEMLHQYGAPDFYVANDYINQRYVDYLSSNDSKDIMFYINKGTNIESKFTDLDAYYVGIGSRPSEADNWNLSVSEYERG